MFELFPTYLSLSADFTGEKVVGFNVGSVLPDALAKMGGVMEGLPGPLMILKDLRKSYFDSFMAARIRIVKTTTTLQASPALTMAVPPSPTIGPASPVTYEVSTTPGSADGLESFIFVGIDGVLMQGGTPSISTGTNMQTLPAPSPTEPAPSLLAASQQAETAAAHTPAHTPKGNAGRGRKRATSAALSSRAYKQVAITGYMSGTEPPKQININT